MYVCVYYLFELYILPLYIILYIHYIIDRILYHRYYIIDIYCYIYILYINYVFYIYIYIYILRYILYICYHDYLCEISLKANVVTDEGNCRNEM